MKDEIKKEFKINLYSITTPIIKTMVMLLSSLIALLDKEILTKMKNNRKID
jgi:hypothetical protein